MPAPSICASVFQRQGTCGVTSPELSKGFRPFHPSAPWQVIAAGTDKRVAVDTCVQLCKEACGLNLPLAHQCLPYLSHECAACSHLPKPDPRLAMSCGEDRALKLWDLSRGFCARSIPCTKMPNVLACSREGSVLATGWWDSDSPQLHALIAAKSYGVPACKTCLQNQRTWLEIVGLVRLPQPEGVSN
eukprot:1144923-Pelagomonas_calceolata.AAC.5